MENNQILSKEILAEGIKKIVVNCPLIARKCQPGQFVIVRLKEYSERVPLTINDFDRNKGLITLIFQEVGKSTVELGMVKEGDVILDVVGPLGKPSHIENYGTVVCIGGGVGTAVIYPVVRSLKQAGNKVISIIGARSQDLLILVDEVKQYSDELIITTDDGTAGRKGFVTDGLKELIQRQEKIDLVFAIGPVIMMKAVVDVTKPVNIPTIVSLNPIMMDGTGMCGVCLSLIHI